MIKKAMIEAAELMYLAADSTKMGKAAFASLGALSPIEYIIIDAGIEEKHKGVFKNNEIELIITS